MTHDEIQALRSSLREAQAEITRLREAAEAPRPEASFDFGNRGIAGDQGHVVNVEPSAHFYALTDDEWRSIEQARKLAAKQAACPHLSIQAGTGRCLTCGGTSRGD